MSLSTLEDGIAALLECPLEQTLHRQLVDRVCEDYSDPRRALLDVVLRHRASDGPRLAYATFCEMNGEAERGEFIRVQCELAQPPEALWCNHSEVWRRDCLRCKLRDRERELLNANDNGEFGPTNGANWFRWSRSLHEIFGYENRGKWQYDFARGFIAELTCNATDWLAHADAVLSEHPVEKVTLTTPLSAEFLRLIDPKDITDNIFKAVNRRWGGIEFQVPGGTVRWSGAASDNWSDPANWQEGTVPTTGDSVYIEEQVPATDEFANYSQQLHDDLIRGLGIPATSADPRLAEIDRHIAILEGRLAHLLRMGRPIFDYPGIPCDEQERILRETLDACRRFRVWASINPMSMLGVSDVRRMFEAWRARNPA